MVSNQGEKTGKKNHLLFQKTAQPLLHDQAGHLSPKSTPVIQLKPQPKMNLNTPLNIRKIFIFIIMGVTQERNKLELKKRGSYGSE